MNRDNFKKALADILDEEIAEYSKAEIESAHIFSHHYKARKKQIISEQGEYHFVAHHRHGYSPRGRRIAILVAVLIMVMAMTAVAVAVIKPHIYYVIKETLTSYDITFDRVAEDDPDARRGANFCYMKPKTPNGYHVTEQQKYNDYYSIDYADNNGHMIFYSQYLPEDTKTFFDSERHKIHVELIEGNEVIIGVSEKDVLSICNNGNYVFDIGGNCDEMIVKEMMRSVLCKPQ